VGLGVIRVASASGVMLNAPKVGWALVSAVGVAVAGRVAMAVSLAAAFGPAWFTSTNWSAPGEGVNLLAGSGGVDVVSNADGVGVLAGMPVGGVVGLRSGTSLVVGITAALRTAVPSGAAATT
jgi:uncharacterized protein (DUF2345 family)